MSGPRVLLLALGTRGDVEPFARLGQTLRAQGYDVTAAVLADGAPRLERAGVRAVVVGPTADHAMWSPRPMVRRAAHLNPGLMYLQLRLALSTHAPELARGLAPLLTEADVVISGLPTARLVPLLTARGVPARLVLMAPLLPDPYGTSAWSHPVADRLPGAVEDYRQRMLWRMTTGLSSALAEALTAEVGRPSQRPGRHLATAYPPVLATSAALHPDAAPDLHRVGWWVDPAPVRPLPTDLTAHLDGHPGAVLLALGSMPTTWPDRQADRLAGVARSLGRPAVVQVAGARPGPRGSSYVVGDVDHRSLLPRVAAVAHHGGSGTTHAVTSAGVPQVVLPHLGDQAHYARQVHRAGLGPAPLPWVRAADGPLTARLARVLDDPGYAERARAAAAVMGREDGLRTTVRLVDTMTGTMTR
ncbi:MULTISPECIES: glycosyltransferase [unclassified Ornithinimicrobium]|uniref:glycosyltransferase n=1 Tax=unclassified Ornithinimicrobium TaxID=2615080 RepID=UPI0038534A2F